MMVLTSYFKDELQSSKKSENLSFNTTLMRQPLLVCLQLEKFSKDQ